MYRLTRAVLTHSTTAFAFVMFKCFFSVTDFCPIRCQVKPVCFTAANLFYNPIPTFTITSKPRPDNDFVRYTSYADTLPENVVTPAVKAVKAAKSAVPTDQASSDNTKAVKG